VNLLRVEDSDTEISYELGMDGCVLREKRKRREAVAKFLAVFIP
jgi:hypothetical protein